MLRSLISLTFKIDVLNLTHRKVQFTAPRSKEKKQIATFILMRYCCHSKFYCSGQRLFFLYSFSRYPGIRPSSSRSKNFGFRILNSGTSKISIKLSVRRNEDVKINSMDIHFSFSFV